MDKTPPQANGRFRLNLPEYIKKENVLQVRITGVAPA